MAIESSIERNGRASRPGGGVDDTVDHQRRAFQLVLRTVADADFKAMRFEKDIVEVSLAHLTGEKEKFETLKESVIEVLGELPLSINTVEREEQLIRQAQTNNYWATITEGKLDELIQKLSPMMKYREAIIPLSPAKFNLKDFVSEKEYVEFGPEHQALSVAKYGPVNPLTFS